VTNHAVICGLAERLGASHPGFSISEREHIDWMLKASGLGDLASLEAGRWIDCQPPFEEAHYLDGFAWPDGRFRFAPDWEGLRAPNRPTDGLLGDWRDIPAFPDHWPVTEEANEDWPFRLVTAPARSFLNSTFNETPGSREREGRPAVMIHPDDAAPLGVRDGDRVALENARGRCELAARLFDGVRQGVLVAEGIWPNGLHAGGRGINALTGADPIAPFGGAAFHDNRVALARIEPPAGFELVDARPAREMAEA
jgi:anaerobic selenocysteine-containing dehydrogenase